MDVKATTARAWKTKQEQFKRIGFLYRLSFSPQQANGRLTEKMSKLCPSVLWRCCWRGDSLPPIEGMAILVEQA
jgi:hypothetical protein